MTSLQIELALPTYIGLTDAAAAALLNAPIVAGRKPVAMGDIKPLIYQDAIPSARLRIEDVVDAGPPPATSLNYAAAYSLWCAAREVLAWLQDPHVEYVDMDNPTTKMGIAAIVAGGVISQALAGQIDALANVTTTRAEQIHFMRPVTAADVTKARAK